MGDETDTPTSTTCNKIPKIMFMNGTWCPVLALGTFEVMELEFFQYMYTYI